MEIIKIMNEKIFLEKYTTGYLNINEKLILDNKEITFIELVLKLCKNNNYDLLYILNKLRISIELYLNELINKNKIIDNNIKNILNEWSLDIKSNEIFNKLNINYEYNLFIEDNEKYNDIKNVINKFNYDIKNNNYNLNSDIKDALLLLNINCKECIDNLKNHIDILIKIINEIEPKYNYILINLSNIHKSEYMNNIKIENSDYNSLLSIKNNKDIPENINIIFLNYIYVINYLKKEYHYLISTMKTMLLNINKDNETFNTLTENLNIKEEDINLENIINSQLSESSDDD